jgi:sugar lactone lactonase YvrE
LKTIAGPSTFYTGDGGPAVNARFYNVEGFRFDSSGNLFIADSGNQRVREVTPDGLVRTIAGTGVAGFTGDGGPATSAELNTPIAVTPDNEGNIFIADQGNNRIRKIDASGTISTVAGNGTANYGGDGGLAVSAELQHPQDLVVDVNGNLYVSDSWNYRVRKITAQGIISTVAGNGQHPYPAQDNERAAGTDQPLNLPAGLAVDAKGNLYISDSGADRVFVVDPDGTISTYAGTGTIGVIQDGSPATATPIQFPTGLALDGLGDLIIASESGTLEVEPSGTLSFISSGENVYYGAVGFNQNSLYVAYRNSIYAVANPSAPPIAGAWQTGDSGDGGPATQALFYYPAAIAVDKNSNLYIADQNDYKIRKVAPDGTISHVAGTGQMGDSGDGGPAASAAIGLITGLAFDPMGNLYLADYYSNVRKIDTSGVISTVTPQPLQNFWVRFEGRLPGEPLHSVGKRTERV